MAGTQTIETQALWIGATVDWVGFETLYKGKVVDTGTWKTSLKK